MPRDFETELVKMVEDAQWQGMPDWVLVSKVALLHRKHGREIPPPITGTLTITEPEDRLR